MSQSEVLPVSSQASRGLGRPSSPPALEAPSPEFGPSAGDHAIPRYQERRLNPPPRRGMVAMRRVLGTADMLVASSPPPLSWCGLSIETVTSPECAMTSTRMISTSTKTTSTKMANEIVTTASMPQVGRKRSTPDRPSEAVKTTSLRRLSWSQRHNQSVDAQEIQTSSSQDKLDASCSERISSRSESDSRRAFVKRRKILNKHTDPSLQPRLSDAEGHTKLGPCGVDNTNNTTPKPNPSIGVEDPSVGLLENRNVCVPAAPMDVLEISGNTDQNTAAADQSIIIGGPGVTAGLPSADLTTDVTARSPSADAASSTPPAVPTSRVLRSRTNSPQPKPKRKYVCGLCGGPGHNRKRCTARNSADGDNCGDAVEGENENAAEKVTDEAGANIRRQTHSEPLPKPAAKPKGRRKTKPKAKTKSTSAMKKSSANTKKNASTVRKSSDNAMKPAPKKRGRKPSAAKVGVLRNGAMWSQWELRVTDTQAPVPPPLPQRCVRKRASVPPSVPAELPLSRALVLRPRWTAYIVSLLRFVQRSEHYSHAFSDTHASCATGVLPRVLRLSSWMFGRPAVPAHRRAHRGLPQCSCPCHKPKSSLSQRTEDTNSGAMREPVVAVAAWLTSQPARTVSLHEPCLYSSACICGLQGCFRPADRPDGTATLSTTPQAHTPTPPVSNACRVRVCLEALDAILAPLMLHRSDLIRRLSTAGTTDANERAVRAGGDDGGRGGRGGFEDINGMGMGEYKRTISRTVMRECGGFIGDANTRASAQSSTKPPTNLHSSAHRSNPHGSNRQRQAQTMPPTRQTTVPGRTDSMGADLSLSTDPDVLSKQEADIHRQLRALHARLQRIQYLKMRRGCGTNESCTSASRPSANATEVCGDAQPSPAAFQAYRRASGRSLWQLATSCSLSQAKVALVKPGPVYVSPFVFIRMFGRATFRKQTSA